MPGHVLVVENGTCASSATGSYPEPQISQGLSAEDYQRLLLEKLDESVQAAPDE